MSCWRRNKGVSPAGRRRVARRVFSEHSSISIDDVVIDKGEGGQEFQLPDEGTKMISNDGISNVKLIVED